MQIIMAILLLASVPVIIICGLAIANHNSHDIKKLKYLKNELKEAKIRQQAIEKVLKEELKKTDIITAIKFKNSQEYKHDR